MSASDKRAATDRQNGDEAALARLCLDAIRRQVAQDGHAARVGSAATPQPVRDWLRRQLPAIHPCTARLLRQDYADVRSAVAQWFFRESRHAAMKMSG